MYRIIFINFLIFFCILNFHSQDILNIPVTDEKIIGSITFEGLKTTNPKYLLSKISIKEGSVWNEEVKETVKDELLDISSIIEDLTITAIEKENNIIDIKINILEKGAFIFIPYFTYSNSQGIMPKIIFRHYNIGGFRKYLNSKVEFIPKKSTNILFKFKDPEANFNNNISYQLETEFRTSLINYFSQGDIRYIGVLGDSNQGERWNDELFIQGILKGNLTYNIPYYDIEITPSAKFDYKRLLNKEEGADLPVDVINPELGLAFNFPIKSIKSYLKPSFNLEYEYTLGDEDLSDALELHPYRNRYDKLIPEAKLIFSYLIPYFDARLEPYIKLVYELNNSYYYANESSDSFMIKDTPNNDYLDLIFGINFYKSFSFWKIKHKFTIETEFEQRLYGNTTVTKTYNTEEDEYSKYYPYNFKSKLDLIYEFDYNTFKSHHFKMRYLLFTRYNQLYEIGGYRPGRDPGDLEGFAGLIVNLKYELPLFDLDTPKFVSINMKRPLRWQVFWDFFLDLGLAATDMADYEDNYTFDLNFLHLYPALGLGTAIRILPKFVPIEIVLEVGGDIYDMYKQRTISGDNIYIKFSIEDKF